MQRYEKKAQFPLTSSRNLKSITSETHTHTTGSEAIFEGCFVLKQMSSPHTICTFPSTVLITN